MIRRVFLALLGCLLLTGCGSPMMQPGPQTTTAPATPDDSLVPTARRSPGAAPAEPADVLLARGTHGEASVNVAIAGDSTGYSYLSWPRVWLDMVHEAEPGRRLVTRDWDEMAGGYGDDVVVGEGEGPGSAGITLINGSVPGSRLDYHLAQLEQMYPSTIPIDVLVVNTGHNEEDADADQLRDRLDSFLAAYLALHPESAVLISSQNPQFSPVRESRREAHAQRQASLRGYAEDHGYTYLPVYESWLTQPDEGRSLVARDGIHPTQGGQGATSPDTRGSIYWAGLFRDLVDGAR